ncbi:MAG TPA: hypothetical protein DDX99_12620 [Desulfofustis sp.]|jgi:hypothetical protein|nr:hypothetical protein [Desulfofustis sp.]
MFVHNEGVREMLPPERVDVPRSKFIEQRKGWAERVFLTFPFTWGCRIYMMTILVSQLIAHLQDPEFITMPAAEKRSFYDAITY